MSELQTKLGGGLNMLQGSLQQGKQKLQVAQEISQQKKLINESTEKKVELLLKMGEAVYKKVRNQEVSDPQLQSWAGEIIAFDKNIYRSQQILDQLNITSQGSNCKNCGGALTGDDKFCGSCGHKVELPENVEHSAIAVCGTCEVEVPAESSYCICCGNQLAGGGR